MSFDAKSQIMKAINDTNDPAMRTVLLLMLGVFEEIGGKIDNILKNERALRETVLNGHTDSHHSHHEWVSKRMQRDEEIEEVIDWVAAKMVQEREAEEDKRKIKVGFVQESFKYVLVAAVGGLLTWAGLR
jgi:hypothetical protein